MLSCECSLCAPGAGGVLSDVMVSDLVSVAGTVLLSWYADESGTRRVVNVRVDLACDGDSVLFRVSDGGTVLFLSDGPDGLNVVHPRAYGSVVYAHVEDDFCLALQGAIRSGLPESSCESIASLSVFGSAFVRFEDNPGIHASCLLMVDGVSTGRLYREVGGHLRRVMLSFDWVWSW